MFDESYNLKYIDLGVAIEQSSPFLSGTEKYYSPEKFFDVILKAAIKSEGVKFS